MKVVYQTAVYDPSIDGAAYPQHIMGDVPDDWTRSQIEAWASPQIDIPGEFKILLGSHDGKPAWICWEVP